MRIFKIFISVLCVVFLTACAETELASHLYKVGTTTPNQGTFKVGKPYRALGQTYVPRETYTYTETGIASWYGPGFHGKKTANGEEFDKNELTAAHRTLQMPSLVRVTNLENGRSLVVRINDRGPFKRGRIIDLSEKAASLLGFKGRGVAKVRVDLLTNESRAIANAAKTGRDTRGMEVTFNKQPGSYKTASLNAPAPVADVPGHISHGAFYPDPIVTHQAVTPSNIYIQAGAFADPSNANHLADRLRAFGQSQVVPAMVNGRSFYRVRVGPVSDVESADALLSRILKAGHDRALIVVN